MVRDERLRGSVVLPCHLLLSQLVPNQPEQSPVEPHIHSLKPKLWEFLLLLLIPFLSVFAIGLTTEKGEKEESHSTGRRFHAHAMAAVMVQAYKINDIPPMAPESSSGERLIFECQ